MCSLKTVVSIAAIVLLTACGGDGSTSVSSSAPESTSPALVSDDSIVAAPSTAEPGELVELTFPTELERGANWHLMKWNGESWSDPLYFVVASTSGYNGDGPDWRPRSEEWSGEDIGFLDGGPDTVIVPESADVGTWRFCTANAPGGSYCVIVTVSTDG